MSPFFDRFRVIHEESILQLLKRKYFQRKVRLWLLVDNWQFFAHFELFNKLFVSWNRFRCRDSSFDCKEMPQVRTSLTCWQPDLGLLQATHWCLPSVTVPSYQRIIYYSATDAICKNTFSQSPTPISFDRSVIFRKCWTLSDLITVKSFWLRVLSFAVWPPGEIIDWNWH